MSSGAHPERATVTAVARGGAANLIGAVIYGASNFGLLVVLNRVLGVRPAGVVVVAIAVFNITYTIASLGCSTGLIRIISRDRATGHAERLRATVTVAAVPVVAVGVLGALAMWAGAGWLAERFTDPEVAGQRDEVAGVLRAMAPFLPVAALHSVAVQGTRGFDTMLPQVVIEKIGRAVALPVVVALGAWAGFGPRGVGAVWAATNLVALVFSARALLGRVRRAIVAGGVPPVPVDREITRDFWSFTGPRAIGQASEVAVSWIDTILIAGIVSTTLAGIYASGTRYLLPGLFAAEALMQVTGPRISGLVATHRHAAATHLVQSVAGWQVVVMWPLYLLIAVFPTPLLQVFGDEVVQARGALVWLAVSMLVAAPFGPASSVILMAGRSRQAMLNTLLLLTVNVGGNLLLVPEHGISAAGLVWGVTIVVAAALPSWQAHRTLRIATLGRPAVVAACLAGATVGTAAVLVRLLLGDDFLGLIVAGSLGGSAYLVGLRALRVELGLDALRDGIRPLRANGGPRVGAPVAGDQP